MSAGHALTPATAGLALTLARVVGCEARAVLGAVEDGLPLVAGHRARETFTAARELGRAVERIVAVASPKFVTAYRAKPRKAPPAFPGEPVERIAGRVEKIIALADAINAMLRLERWSSAYALAAELALETIALGRAIRERPPDNVPAQCSERSGASQGHGNGAPATDPANTSCAAPQPP